MTLPTEHLFADTGENSSIALLKQHFPQCFDKGGLFLPDKLAEQLQTANVPVSREYYTMNWLGKSYARYLCDCPPITLLGEDSAHNTQSQNQHSQNLLIKGDNLEVLKHLKNAYANQVKMIYIDPPYNTGSDGFVYQDDRKFTPDELAKLADMSTDEARRVLDFTAKKSNSHSAWLTFMYPRLYVAHELLKDDGVIFISIDDNEQAQLKLLCDEVFGEENFVSKVIRRAKIGGGSDNKQFATEADYLFVYAKSKEKVNTFYLSHTDKDLKRYKEIDEIGKFFWDTYSRSGLSSGDEEESLFYAVEFPDGSVREDRWRRSKDRLEKDLQEREAKYVQTQNGWNIHFKQRLPEQGKRPRQILFDGFGNTKGADRIEYLLGNSKIFDYSKPIEFIQFLISISTNKNDIVMDFFAGSGSTADAVLNYNKDNEDKFCNYICVQLPEILDLSNKHHKAAIKAGYQTIFDITQARIEKAAEKIKSEYSDYQGDLGFKIFETMPDFRATDDELSPQLEFPEMLHANLEPKQYETLLTTWCVYDGNALTQSVQSVELGGYSANLCGTTLYVVYPDFDSVAIKALLDKLDHDADFIIERIVLFGEMVESAKQRELKQALDTYNNKKNVHLSLLVRY